MSDKPEQKSPGTPETQKFGYAIVMRNDQSAVLEREVVMASIRLAYLKLAIIVVLLMIIVWYIYSSISKTTTERLKNRTPRKSNNVTVAESNANWDNRTREPPTSQSTVPFMSGWYGASDIKRPLGQLGQPGQLGQTETQEGFAPYASWLTPDIYNSDPSHDDHLSNKSHYGMYAPYDLSYLYPNNIELPAHRRDTNSNANKNGARSKESNVYAEHLVAYAQPRLDADDIGGEVNVPEKQLESDAGLLFGLTNYDDVPMSHGAPL